MKLSDDKICDECGYEYHATVEYEQTLENDHNKLVFCVDCIHQGMDLIQEEYTRLRASTAERDEAIKLLTILGYEVSKNE